MLPSDTTHIYVLDIRKKKKKENASLLLGSHATYHACHWPHHSSLALIISQVMNSRVALGILSFASQSFSFQISDILDPMDYP
jgi:hypothetical protein